MSDVAVSEAPLEFDPFSDEYFDSPYDLYRRMRDEAPVYFNEKYGFWALFRHEDVCAAHKDWQTFSSSHGVDLSTLNTDPEVDPDVPVHHHDGPARARPAPGPGQPGVHPPGRGGPRAHGARGHPVLPRSVRRRRLLRRRGRLQRPVPGRDHLPDAGRARGRAPADPPLARPVAPPRARADGPDPRGDPGRHRWWHLLVRAGRREAAQPGRRHDHPPHPGGGGPGRRRDDPAGQRGDRRVRRPPRGGRGRDGDQAGGQRRRPLPPQPGRVPEGGRRPGQDSRGGGGDPALLPALAVPGPVLGARTPSTAGSTSRPATPPS